MTAMELREKTPQRRPNPKKVSRYSESKPELREDFNCRCGHCDDHEFFRDTPYEIDHFVPQGCLKSISLTDYSNLVYSCKSCNNAKRKKWPTGDEKVHNDGHVGFIDSCDEEYSKQFERQPDGSIRPVTDLGKWMWEALKLYKPSHQYIWQLEQIKKKLEELEKYKSNPEVAMKISELVYLYFDYLNQLRGTPVF